MFGIAKLSSKKFLENKNFNNIEQLWLKNNFTNLKVKK